MDGLGFDDTGRFVSLELSCWVVANVPSGKVETEGFGVWLSIGTRSGREVEEDGSGGEHKLSIVSN